MATLLLKGMSTQDARNDRTPSLLTKRRSPKTYYVADTDTDIRSIKYYTLDGHRERRRGKEYVSAGQIYTYPRLGDGARYRVYG